MGQSLSKIYIHLVFSTKHRYPFIADEIRPQLHDYLAGILYNLDSPSLVINSMPDHVHILFRLSKNFSLAKVVEELKKSSSKWAKTKGVQNFFWQNGYGAFSVNSSNLEAVIKYIENQQVHHKKTSFREEVVDFMKRYSVEDYNDDFFWN